MWNCTETSCICSLELFLCFCCFVIWKETGRYIYIYIFSLTALFSSFFFVHIKREGEEESWSSAVLSDICAYQILTNSNCHFKKWNPQCLSNCYGVTESLHKMCIRHAIHQIQPWLTFFTLASFSFSRASLILSALSWASISSCKITHRLMKSSHLSPLFITTIHIPNILSNTEISVIAWCYGLMRKSDGTGHPMPDQIHDMSLHHFTRTKRPYV